MIGLLVTVSVISIAYPHTGRYTHLAKTNNQSGCVQFSGKCVRLIPRPYKLLPEVTLKSSSQRTAVSCVYNLMWAVTGFLYPSIGQKGEAETNLEPKTAGLVIRKYPNYHKRMDRYPMKVLTPAPCNNPKRAIAHVTE